MPWSKDNRVGIVRVGGANGTMIRSGYNEWGNIVVVILVVVVLVYYYYY
jgi:hypothetical protein